MSRRRTTFLLAIVLAAGPLPAFARPSNGGPPDTIDLGGPILTMNGDKAVYAEAVVVDEGRIVFIGAKAKAHATRVRDLGGKIMLPGFIGAHGHFDAEYATYRRRVGRWWPRLRARAQGVA